MSGQFCTLAMFLSRYGAVSRETNPRDRLSEQKPAFAIASNIRCKPASAVEKSVMAFFFSELPLGNPSWLSY